LIRSFAIEFSEKAIFPKPITCCKWLKEKMYTFTVSGCNLESSKHHIINPFMFWVGIGHVTVTVQLVQNKEYLFRALL
jgi:hypothetical protein